MKTGLTMHCDILSYDHQDRMHQCLLNMMDRTKMRKRENAHVVAAQVGLRQMLDGRSESTDSKGKKGIRCKFHFSDGMGKRPYSHSKKTSEPRSRSNSTDRSRQPSLSSDPSRRKDHAAERIVRTSMIRMLRRRHLLNPGARQRRRRGRRAKPKLLLRARLLLCARHGILLLPLYDEDHSFFKMTNRIVHPSQVMQIPIAQQTKTWTVL